MSRILDFLAPFWTKILEGLAIVGALVGTVAYIRKTGKDAQKLDDLNKTMEMKETSDAVERHVDTLQPGSAADELHKRFQR